MICPFFGQNEDYCDVGCGYISPSDVKKIIQFCSTHPDRCPVFQYLMERHPGIAAHPAWTESAPALQNSAPLPQPVAPGPPSAAVMLGAKLAMAPEHAGKNNSRASGDTLAKPAPSGLLAFGLTTALLSLHQTGLLPIDNTMLGMGVFYGGLCQIIVGFLEWKRHHAFGATAFTSLGLFWLSLIAMSMLSGSSFGQFPQDAAMAAYLVLWGLFTLVLFIGALRLNRSLQFVLGSLMLFYFLLAAGTATGNRIILAGAGWDGVLCALSAIYTGLAQILNEIFGRSVVPLGEHNCPTPRMVQKRPS